MLVTLFLLGLIMLICKHVVLIICFACSIINQYPAIMILSSILLLSFRNSIVLIRVISIELIVSILNLKSLKMSMRKDFRNRLIRLQVELDYALENDDCSRGLLPALFSVLSYCWCKSPEKKNRIKSKNYKHE